MAGRLKTVAELLGYTDIRAVPWHALRYEHVAAIRAKLQELGKAPATVNALTSAGSACSQPPVHPRLGNLEDPRHILT